MVQKPGILMLLAGSLIALVVVAAVIALDRVKTRIQADVGEALQTVLQTTQEFLNMWVDIRKFDLGQAARDPRNDTAGGRPLGRRLYRLVDDFDLNGVLKLAEELDGH